MQNKQMTEWEKLALKIESEEWRDRDLLIRKSSFTVALVVKNLPAMQKLQEMQV